MAGGLNVLFPAGHTPHTRGKKNSDHVWTRAKPFVPGHSVIVATTSLTPDLYAVLSGTLDSSAVPRILASFGNASQNNVHHMHVLFQSTIGGIREGICLYDFFSSFSILTFYNMDVLSFAH